MKNQKVYFDGPAKSIRPTTKDAKIQKMGAKVNKMNKYNKNLLSYLTNDDE